MAGRTLPPPTFIASGTFSPAFYVSFFVECFFGLFFHQTWRPTFSREFQNSPIVHRSSFVFHRLRRRTSMPVRPHRHFPHPAPGGTWPDNAVDLCLPLADRWPRGHPTACPGGVRRMGFSGRRHPRKRGLTGRDQPGLPKLMAVNDLSQTPKFPNHPNSHVPQFPVMSPLPPS